MKLFDAQLDTWQLAQKNYEALKNVLCKEIRMDGFSFFVQFNPERIRSAAAAVDEESLKNRACFLCSENRPPEQIEIPFQSRYSLLVNPYPIFPQHLTIPDNKHLPQRIKGRMSEMLDLAHHLDDFVILYNGPKCGASAPDHFHFQAGNKGFLPIENDVKNYSKQEILLQNEEGTVYQLNDYLRKTIILKSKNKDWLLAQFEQLSQKLQTIHPEENEPMYNLISWHEKTTWTLVVFPRKAHRPHQFYETGEKQLLLSPGVVDFGGVIICARKEDYDRIDAYLLQDIYQQLS